MPEWLVNLPIIWMALVIFLGTYLVAAAVYLIVMRLAVNDRVRAFKGLSPGMLPPLGILFGLLVGFMAAQVWSDFERAKLAVATEASALRTAILLAESFTGDTETRLRTLINRHIEEAVNQEWPEMAQQQETLRDLPITLIEALKITLALTPNSESQKVAMHEIVAALEKALDARRQRIILSQSTITPIKWSALLLQYRCCAVGFANGYLLPSFHRSHFRRTGALAASHQRSQRRNQPLAHFHFDWAIGTNRLTSAIRLE